jgi:hypothetical protein
VPLSADQLAVLRSMLEEQRAFRLDQLAQLLTPGTHGPLGTSDPELFRTLSAGARAALRDVQAALRRMDEGRYGLCTECGDPVGVERLEILPQTPICLACHRSTGG